MLYELKGRSRSGEQVDDVLKHVLATAVVLLWLGLHRLIYDNEWCSSQDIVTDSVSQLIRKCGQPF